jgi:hypothetical protein
VQPTVLIYYCTAVEYIFIIKNQAIIDLLRREIIVIVAALEPSVHHIETPPISHIIGVDRGAHTEREYNSLLKSSMSATT